MSGPPPPPWTDQQEVTNPRGRPGEGLCGVSAGMHAIALTVSGGDRLKLPKLSLADRTNAHAHTLATRVRARARAHTHTQGIGHQQDTGPSSPAP